MIGLQRAVIERRVQCPPVLDLPKEPLHVANTLFSDRKSSFFPILIRLVGAIP